MTKNDMGRALVGAALVMAGLTAATVRAGEPTHGAAGDVAVTVKYNGKGTVDATHKIWVWLFTSPDIGPGAVPVAESSIETNGGTASFVNIGADKVWIAIAVDEGGGLAGAAPPPAGAPVTLYTDGKGPAAVTPGPGAKVTVTFDDSQRMQ